MPNIGGPKQRRRALLSSVVTSVLTYGISIWADVLQLQEARHKIAPVYRLSALRVASAYRTVSEGAVCVISRIIPIEVLAEERRSLYERKRSEALNSEELKIQERRNSLSRWQQKWSDSTKGRWTYRLISQVAAWMVFVTPMHILFQRYRSKE
ncbi:uncharacterized protein LOC107042377 [Diachasma alloeum]|uniref:uncharacterized protein LOC107042377 n=1 Tax=Diachasma alloeum TaxID=454923 RepID=UPI000738434F|nr:uncharacterized protein LOC107042377 [Diachasma alloeum]